MTDLQPGDRCPKCGEPINSIGTGITKGVPEVRFGHGYGSTRTECRLDPADPAEEALQSRALGALEAAMKRWGVKPSQLQSPYRELVAFTPEGMPLVAERGGAVANQWIQRAAKEIQRLFKDVPVGAGDVDKIAGIIATTYAACPECDGNGSISDDRANRKTCSKCGGSGYRDRQ